MSSNVIAVTAYGIAMALHAIARTLPCHFYSMPRQSMTTPRVDKTMLWQTMAVP